MPVARSSGHAGRALLVAGVSVVLLVVGLWAVSVVLSRKPSTEVKLGDQVFDAGNAREIADEIADNGPVIYGDVSGERSRDIIIQHLGDDPDTGWYALAAQPPDQPRDCAWEWQPDEQQFRASCDEDLTAPADGAGLQRWEVEVDDGDLSIDLNADARETTTSSVVISGDEQGG